MSAAPKLPVEYVEDNAQGQEPVVTLIGADLPHAYLEEAEPSPLMEQLSKIWSGMIRLFKIGVLLVLLGGYPAAMVLGHQIDSSPVALSQASPWASAEIGTAQTLIGRELTGPGWAEDRPVWHPQARLTALPAWQEGLTSALSEFMMLSAALSADAGGQPDPDLMAAARLLLPSAESHGTPRLNAAAEALQRYEGRLSRGLSQEPRGAAVLLQEFDLMSSWAVDAQTALKASADRAEAWPASRMDIETIYVARAQAHIAAQMLNATLLSEPELVATREVAEARDQALFAWERAAQFRPLFVTSQAGTGRFLADHPAIMAFYMAEAEQAMVSLKEALEAQQNAMSVAATESSAP